MRFTRNKTDTEMEDICGGSFYASQNRFIDNTAVLHSSNGGAISLECDFVNALPNQAVSNFKGSYKGKISLLSVISIKKRYSIGLFTSKIVGNRFEGNEIGQKGSAIYARQITYVDIQDNIFMKNMPSYSFRLNVNRPYEKYFYSKIVLQDKEILTNSPLFPYLPAEKNELKFLENMETKNLNSPAFT